MQSQQWLKRFFPLFLGICCLVTGCVNYDVGVHFPEQHYGEIVQHITLGEQLTTLSQAEADRWLKSLDQRARDLNGAYRSPVGANPSGNHPLWQWPGISAKIQSIF